jgi:hypothetical protein
MSLSVSTESGTHQLSRSSKVFSSFDVSQRACTGLSGVLKRGTLTVQILGYEDGSCTPYEEPLHAQRQIVGVADPSGDSAVRTAAGL